MKIQRFLTDFHIDLTINSSNEKSRKIRHNTMVKYCLAQYLFDLTEKNHQMKNQEKNRENTMIIHCVTEYHLDLTEKSSK